MPHSHKKISMTVITSAVHILLFKIILAEITVLLTILRVWYGTYYVAFHSTTATTIYRSAANITDCESGLAELVTPEASIVSKSIKNRFMIIRDCRD